MSFVKLSAGRRGYAPSHDVAEAPLPAHVAQTTAAATSASHPDDEERKSRQATGSSSSNGGGVGGDKSQGAASRSDLPLRKGSGASISARPRSSKRFFLAGGGAPQGEDAVAGGMGGLYSDNSCSVCLDEYEEGDQRLQLTCGHVFHRPCIDHWLKGHRVCPCCRWAGVWARLHRCEYITLDCRGWSWVGRTCRKRFSFPCAWCLLRCMVATRANQVGTVAAAWRRLFNDARIVTMWFGSFWNMCLCAARLSFFVVSPAESN